MSRPRSSIGPPLPPRKKRATCWAAISSSSRPTSPMSRPSLAKPGGVKVGPSMPSGSTALPPIALTRQRSVRQRRERRPASSDPHSPRAQNALSPCARHDEGLMSSKDITSFFRFEPVGKRIEDLETPVPIIDIDVVDRNLKRWQARCDEIGIANRPHIKTHKLAALAKYQMALGAKGITVQKLGEAEVMADAGITDM